MNKTITLFMLMLLASINAFAQISEAKKKEIERLYDYVDWSKFSEYKIIQIKRGEKQGILNAKGDLLIPCEFDKIEFYPRDYMARVTNNGKEGAYDVRKKGLVIPCDFDCIIPKKGYFAKVFQGEKMGYYDMNTEKLIIPTLYDYIDYSTSYLKGCLAEVVRDNQRGIYDIKRGQEIIPCGTYNYFSISEDIKQAIVCKGAVFNSKKKTFTQMGKWGCIDIENLRIAIPCEYDYISFAGEGLLKCNIGGKISYYDMEPTGGLWGIIDANNKILFKPEYTQISNFKDGVAQVVRNGVAAIIVNPQKGTNLIIANGINSNTIDQNIPKTDKNNENAFAFIFANENYKNGANADYSINDGKIFAKYCQQTLGLPENNVKYYEDATFGNFQSALKKLKDIADVYDGEAKIIFYYSGLGNTIDGKRYILPSDVSLASTKVTAISIDNILSTLNALNTTYTLALFDAPFNGADKSGKMLETARGVKVKSKAPTTTGKVIAVFGSSDDNNNYANKKCAHGLFTYSLLEQLQQSKGEGALKSMIENANSKVDKDALKEFNNIQKPQIIISDMMNNDWQNIKF